VRASANVPNAVADRATMAATALAAIRRRARPSIVVGTGPFSGACAASPAEQLGETPVVERPSLTHL
jgi:hypothetical protein